jgi:hypothetical protein
MIGRIDGHARLHIPVLGRHLRCTAHASTTVYAAPATAPLLRSHGEASNAEGNSGGRKLLFIGAVWPEPTTTAAGIRSLNIINAFNRKGNQSIVRLRRGLPIVRERHSIVRLT